MLMRTPEKGTGLSPELATAATRWRPHGWPGMAWRREGRPSAREGGRRGVWMRRVGTTESRMWPAALHGGGQRRSAPAAEKQRSREVGDEVWTDLQFPKSLGVLL